MKQIIVNGKILNATSRYADQEVAAGRAKYAGKEEKTEIETKEEKQAPKRGTKKK